MGASCAPRSTLARGLLATRSAGERRLDRHRRSWRGCGCRRAGCEGDGDETVARLNPDRLGDPSGRHRREAGATAATGAVHAPGTTTAGVVAATAAATGAEGRLRTTAATSAVGPIVTRDTAGFAVGDA